MVGRQPETVNECRNKSNFKLDGYKWLDERVPVDNFDETFLH